jgi:formyl-CoA transferase
MWERFCNALETPGLVNHPDYASGAGRSRNRDALNAEIGRHTPKRTSADWVERLNKAGVPCGPIYTVDQVYRDPQVEHLRMAQTVRTRDRKSMRMAGQPMTLSRTPSRLAAPTPALGQHTDQVLREFGFSAKAIAALRKAKAI